jgi:hypothetical protein
VTIGIDIRPANFICTGIGFHSYVSFMCIEQPVIRATFQTHLPTFITPLNLLFIYCILVISKSRNLSGLLGNFIASIV